MPSEFVVPVVELRDVRPHPHADRLDVAFALDFPVVLPRGKFKSGDRAVYFPVDAELPDEWIERFGCRGFLHGARQNRVGCATLRGETSFGLVVEIPLPHGADWRVGKNVSGYYKAVKYQPPAQAVAGDIAPYDESIDAFLDEYTHIRNGRLAGRAFVEGETVVVTEKIHGANVKFGMVGDKMVAASMKHRRKRPMRQDGRMAYLDDPECRRHTYWFPWTLSGCQELIRSLRERYKVVLLYGEVFGGGIQTLDYGIPKGHGLGFRAFDLKLDGKYLGWDRLVETCYKFEVPLVPMLHRGPFAPDRIRSFAEGESVLSAQPQIREGVVVRLPTDEMRGHPPERPIFKYISEAYLMRRREGDDKTDL